MQLSISPIFGSIADAGGPRKPWMAFFIALCVIGSCYLWWAVPGQQSGIVWIMAAIVIATVGIELSLVFNNAMLPSLTSRDKIGQLSGNAWGLGYIGGLVALFIVLLGFALPDTTLFNLDKVAHQHDRMTGPMSGIWLLIFAVPMFLFTPDSVRSGLSKAQAISKGLGELRSTLTSLGNHRNMVFFLIARMIYNDGILAVIGFSGIYAAGVFGWTTTNLGIFGIIVVVAAIFGAFAGGWLDDKLGSKPTIVISVIGLGFATVGVVSISDGEVLFGLPAAMPVEDGALFSSAAEQVFMGFSLVMGFFFGPAQAASRTMIARLSPPEKSAEFFGLFALSGKATAFIAPALIGIVTQVSGSQRPGMVVILVLLLIGAALMSFVREPER